MASFTQQALRILEEERRVAQVEEQKRIAAAEAEAAAKAQAERSVRVQLQAERELARIAAERALAEEQALAQRAADARALQAELARLRARSEMDILRDEVAQMRAEQMATLKAYHLARVPQQEIHLRSDGELDMRFKSSKEELATARGEIAELKAVLHPIIAILCHSAPHWGRLDIDDSNQAQGARAAALRKYFLANY
jgi:translation initiation factor IF-2